MLLQCRGNKDQFPCRELTGKVYMHIYVWRGRACIRERDVEPEEEKPVGVWGGRDVSTTFKFIRNYCLGHDP